MALALACSPVVGAVAVGAGSLLGSLAVSGALSLHAINADNINGKMAYFALVLNFFIKVSYN
ncbi:hypothetical protein [Moraxella lacunata]|uniref:hypothetical protein n=1 Tax=Moraxella lacunata TaxID=477 RepID=UPI003EDF9942